MLTSLVDPKHFALDLKSLLARLSPDQVEQVWRDADKIRWRHWAKVNKAGLTGEWRRAKLPPRPEVNDAAALVPYVKQELDGIFVRHLEHQLEDGVQEGRLSRVSAPDMKQRLGEAVLLSLEVVYDFECTNELERRRYFQFL